MLFSLVKQPVLVDLGGGNGLRRGSRGGGGGGGARPPLFVPNSLKIPQNWPKFVKKACVDEPPNPLHPLLFQILDPPLLFSTIG